MCAEPLQGKRPDEITTCAKFWSNNLHLLTKKSIFVKFQNNNTDSMDLGKQIILSRSEVYSFDQNHSFLRNSDLQLQVYTTFHTETIEKGHHVGKPSKWFSPLCGPKLYFAYFIVQWITLIFSQTAHLDLILPHSPDCICPTPSRLAGMPPQPSLPLEVPRTARCLPAPWTTHIASNIIMSPNPKRPRHIDRFSPWNGCSSK